MSFGAPELLPLALAAPIAAAIALWILARRARSESAWMSALLARRLRTGGAPRSRWLVVALAALALLGLALALARPRWGSATTTVERRGLDLVFVLDTSLSMNAADVAPSRFWLAQSLVRRLVAALPGHRVALVAAEGEGEVLAPLTVDAAMIDLVLDGVEPGSLPWPGTLLAPALERAIRLFPEGGRSHRAIVVISDGEDHGSELERAAGAVREAGTRIFTIGVGTGRGAPIPLAGGAGVKRDRQGEVVVSRLDEGTLARLASATGGEAFHAVSASFDPAPVVAAISKLGGREIEATTVTTAEERFQWPLAVAVGALAASLALGGWRRRPAAASASPPRAAARSGPATTRAMRRAAALAAIVTLGAGPAEAPADESSAAGLAERLSWNARERTAAGVRALERGDAPAAIDALDTARRLRAGDPLAGFNAGTARIGVEPEPAAQILAPVAGAAPEALAPDAWYNLGNAQLAADDAAAAVDSYVEALRRRPDHRDTKFNLELALRRLEEQRREKREEERDEPRSGPGGGGGGQDPSDSAGGGGGESEGEGGGQSEGEGDAGGDPGGASGRELDESTERRPEGAESRGGEQPDATGKGGDRSADAAGNAESARGTGIENERQGPLPQFRDLPDMDERQAAAILAAVDDLERRLRRERAQREARERARTEVDW